MWMCSPNRKTENQTDDKCDAHGLPRLLALDAVDQPAKPGNARCGEGEVNRMKKRAIKRENRKQLLFNSLDKEVLDNITATAMNGPYQSGRRGPRRNPSDWSAAPPESSSSRKLGCVARHGAKSTNKWK